MKRTMLFIIIMVFAVNSAYGASLKGGVYGEAGVLELRADSFINPENKNGLGEFNYKFSGNLEIRNEFNEFSNGVIKLEMAYNPVSGNPADEKEKIFIKELYMDFLTDIVNVRVGKQYVKWGNGIFFNPVDILNIPRDPLRPANEAEGNSFIQATIPVMDTASLEIFGLIKDGAKKVSQIPLIAKVSANLDTVSANGFMMVQEKRQPVYGFGTEFATGISPEIDTVFYGQGIFGTTQDRKKYLSDGISVSTMDSNRISGVIGNRINIRYPYMKRFDSFTIVSEFYYDTENWCTDDYKGFKKYLTGKYGELAQNPSSTSIKSDIETALANAKTLKNGKSYLFDAVTVHNAFIPDMDITGSYVINFSDWSYLIMPEMSYSYNNSNTTTGIKAKIYNGESDSEFGGIPYKWDFSVYTDLAF